MTKTRHPSAKPHRTPEAGHRRRIIVKLKDEHDAPTHGEIGEQLEERGQLPWVQIAQDFEKPKVESLFSTWDPAEVDTLVKTAAKRDPGYTPRKLHNYLVLTPS